MIEGDLARLLISVKDERPANFSGLGLVATKSPGNLPTSSLKIVQPPIKLPVVGMQDILAFLLKISRHSSPYHDGFHIIIPPFALVALSQYFSAPIVYGGNLDYSHGSRFRTAMYGSALKEVIAIGVISQTYEAAIFIDGKRFEPAKIASGQ